MKGKINLLIKYNGGSFQGSLIGSDGEHYSFDSTDFVEGHIPSMGDEIEFKAHTIYKARICRK